MLLDTNPANAPPPCLRSTKRVIAALAMSTTLSVAAFVGAGRIPVERLALAPASAVSHAQRSRQLTQAAPTSAASQGQDGRPSTCSLDHYR